MEIKLKQLKNKIMENTEIKGFDRNPILKQLLINYCNIHYEDNAILDDNHLLMEYNLLLRENRLHDLFECERLNNI